MPTNGSQQRARDVACKYDGGIREGGDKTCTAYIRAAGSRYALLWAVHCVDCDRTFDWRCLYARALADLREHEELHRLWQAESAVTERVARRKRLRKTDVDWVLVDRVCAGEKIDNLTIAERREVLRQLAARGMTDAEIGERLGKTKNAVGWLRARHGITAGVKQVVS